MGAAPYIPGTTTHRNAELNWVDVVVLAVLALSALLAFARGLVREALGLGAWALAGFIASPYGLFPYVQPWARGQFNDPSTADIAAFGGVFLIALIVFWVVAGALSSFVQRSALGGLDRTLGLLFGLARGAVILGAAYIVASIALPPEQWPPPLVQARSINLLYKDAAWLADQVPAQYRPNVAAPPAGARTTAGDLLQSQPTGRALGARPSRE